MMSKPINYGETITLARMGLGLTQADLGKKVGVTTVAVWNWEKGKCKPSSQIIPRLVRVLDLSIEDLLEGGNHSVPRKGVQILLQRMAQYLGGMQITLTPAQAESLFRKFRRQIENLEKALGSPKPIKHRNAQPRHL